MFSPNHHQHTLSGGKENTLNKQTEKQYIKGLEAGLKYQFLLVHYMLTAFVIQINVNMESLIAA